MDAAELAGVTVMTNPEGGVSAVLANLASIHAEFISNHRFMTADVIAQAIALIRGFSPEVSRVRTATDETLRLKRPAAAKTVTGEELLAALEESESDPAYKLFLRETLERLKGAQSAANGG
jgi:hypothetical protein